jgi:hypothetical protein
MVDLIGAQAFVIISINSKDKAPKLLIERNTGSSRRIKMLVVSASIDLQDTAKRNNTMLKTKSVDSV